MTGSITLTINTRSQGRRHPSSLTSRKSITKIGRVEGSRRNTSKRSNNGNRNTTPKIGLLKKLLSSNLLIIIPKTIEVREIVKIREDTNLKTIETGSDHRKRLQHTIKAIIRRITIKNLL